MRRARTLLALSLALGMAAHTLLTHGEAAPPPYDTQATVQSGPSDDSEPTQLASTDQQADEDELVAVEEDSEEVPLRILLR